jgi:DNA-directed RNA polymerase subunit L
MKNETWKKPSVSCLLTNDGVAECKYDFPHPQPFSPRRRKLESGSLALWERVRVRAAGNSYL